MENNPEHKEQKNIGIFMITVMWILLLGLLVYFFEDVIDQKLNPNQALTTRYISENIREVTLLRNNHGHYITNGKINGQKVVFMLDTGATGVAVPQHLVPALSLKRGPEIELHTANGRAKAYMTTINTVGVGDIELKDISAVINPNDKTDIILLGMSFLKQIEFTQRGDELILRQVSGQ